MKNNKIKNIIIIFLTFGNVLYSSSLLIISKYLFSSKKTNYSDIIVFSETSDNINDYYFKLKQINHGMIPFTEGVDNFKFINIVDGTKIKKCYFFDFDGDNGYALFDDYHIYDYSLKGDYPFLLEPDILFSFSDGYIKFDSAKKRYFKYDISSGKNLSDYNNIDILCRDGVFDGVDGKIFNSQLTNYINEVHPGWVLNYSAEMYNFTKLMQNDNSFYRHKYYYRRIVPNGPPIYGYYPGTSYYNNSYSYGEGNCAPNAISTYLYNIPTVIDFNGYCHNVCQNLILGQAAINISAYFDSQSTIKDIFYNDYSNNYYSNNQMPSNWTPPDLTEAVGSGTEVIGVQFKKADVITNPSTIYWQVRSKAIENGFSPTHGLSTSYFNNVLGYVSGLYGYNLELYSTSTISNVINVLDNGIPVIIVTSGSKTYGNHAMVIYGYKKYQYTIPFFNITTYHYIWLVSDGHINENYQTWYDPNHGSSSNYYFCTNLDYI